MGCMEGRPRLALLVLEKLWGKGVLVFHSLFCQPQLKEQFSKHSYFGIPLDPLTLSM